MTSKSIFPVVLNSTNVVEGTNNSVYRYKFPVGSVAFNKCKVALGDISMYYSWYNISAANNNNTFQIVWYGTLIVTRTITIPDGFYDIDTLNFYLQQYCITNDLYLIDDAGDFVYYVQFSENSTYYSVQFNSYPIPTSLPSGWSAPSGWGGYPATASTPQLIVPDTNIQYILGFNPGTYPTVTQTSTYSKLSDFVPQVTPVESIILTCSLLNNQYSNPNTILYCFSPANVSFGSLTESKPSEYAFVNINNGTFSEFQIQFLDQNFNQLKINDNNLIVQLLFEINELDY